VINYTSKVQAYPAKRNGVGVGGKNDGLGGKKRAVSGKYNI
jgi:hypothetical protein